MSPAISNTPEAASFDGQVVLVTGASGGIGSAIAHAFARRGARVVLHYHRGREAAEALRAALPAILDSSEHLCLGADLGDPAAARGLIEEVLERCGGLHVLVNNAGIFETHPPLTSDAATWDEAWRRTLGANLLGPAVLSHGAARHMVEAGGGRIVNITSRGAFRGEPDAPAYGASKAGLNAFGQSLAKALAPHGVFVFSIAPGWVDTDRVAPFVHGEKEDEIRRESPLGRVATPEEVARSVVFLASPGNDSLTGCILDLNGASYLRT
ncbi:MAG: SDR family oxidoreductase [Acidobacteriota bacterium]|nr:SDR family oxidoreductase [Acidobacteriota bacterium]